MLGIYVANIVGPPLDYVAQKSVPTTLLGGPPAVFSSHADGLSDRFDHARMERGG